MSATNALISDYLTQRNLFSPNKRNDITSLNDSFTGFGAITDTLNLSAASISAYTDNWLVNQLRGVADETLDGKYKTLNQVGLDFMNDLSAFNDLASGLFGAAGITAPITLQMNGTGGLKQVGSSDAKVAGVLKDNPVMTPRFAVLAARAAITEAAARDTNFTADYNHNPPATMKKYAATLKELMLNFQLTLANGTAQTSFAA